MASTPTGIKINGAFQVGTLALVVFIAQAAWGLEDRLESKIRDTVQTEIRVLRAEIGKEISDLRYEIVTGKTPVSREEDG